MSPIVRTFLAAFLAAAALVAMPARADSIYDRCVAKGVTNPDYAICGGALLDRLEASLNATWKSVYPGLPAEAKPGLLQEQRLWIAFKDKSCSVYTTSAYGREGQVLSFYTCRASVLSQRIDALKSIGSD